MVFSSLMVSRFIHPNQSPWAPPRRGTGPGERIAFRWQTATIPPSTAETPGNHRRCESPPCRVRRSLPHLLGILRASRLTSSIRFSTSSCIRSARETTSSRADSIRLTMSSASSSEISLRELSMALRVSRSMDFIRLPEHRRLSSDHGRGGPCHPAPLHTAIPRDRGNSNSPESFRWRCPARKEPGTPRRSPGA